MIKKKVELDPQFKKSKHRELDHNQEDVIICIPPSQKNLKCCKKSNAVWLLCRVQLHLELLAHYRLSPLCCFVLFCFYFLHEKVTRLMFFSAPLYCFVISSPIRFVIIHSLSSSLFLCASTRQQRKLVLYTTIAQESRSLTRLSFLIKLSVIRVG